MLKQFLALTGIFALGAMVAQAQLVSPNAQSRPIVKTEAVQ